MKELLKATILILGLGLITACEKKQSGLPIDGDGNEYDTVTIGTQVWLAENLKTTKYNNGVSIPCVTDNTQWTSSTSAAFCWYGNNSIVKDNYGALYNWWAANVSLLCPVGYHVPTKEEWNTLIDYLGGEEIAGDKLKVTGSQFWESGGNHSTNESGFSAMPGGRRMHTDGTFDSMRGYGYWWTSSPGIYDSGARVSMFCSLGYARIGSISKKAGYSVRCIKDY
jgi:uncharacterized protein (TIGR02145 family)